jgi:hypothetical protein
MEFPRRVARINPSIETSSDTETISLDLAERKTRNEPWAKYTIDPKIGERLDLEGGIISTCHCSPSSERYTPTKSSKGIWEWVGETE